MIWPDELETTLIKIMWRYIEGRKLVDNVFKKLDFALMVIELQSIYVSLNISPTTNIITGL